MTQQLTLENILNYLREAKTIKAIKLILLLSTTLLSYFILTTVGQTLQSLTALLFGLNNVIFLYGVYQIYKVVKTQDYPEIVKDLIALFKSVSNVEEDKTSEV